MKPRLIVMHHSLTRDSETASWPVIRDYHVHENGWSDIGYHFGIENLRGQTEILVGRLPDKQGAHCGGHNEDSIGICVVGNFDKESPSKEAWEAAKKIVKYLMRKYAISTVLGHMELNPKKSCPGRLFDMNKFRSEIGL